MVNSDGLVAEFRPRLGRRSPQEEVLRTPELLGLIYSKLIPNRENRLSLSRSEIFEERVQLYRLARTNKLFNALATVDLWARLESFAPLIQSLPNARSVGGAWVSAVVTEFEHPAHSWSEIALSWRNFAQLSASCKSSQIFRFARTTNYLEQENLTRYIHSTCDPNSKCPCFPAPRHRTH